ncbi:MAG: FMN-binding protein [Christensenellales bacterium]|jgi:uncharacterized protein with FMN-binding domain
MKKVTIIVIICFVALALIASGVIIIAGNIRKNLKQLEAEQFGAIDLSEIEDGEYIGSFSVFPVAAKVKVTIVDHEITKIDILEHDNGRGKSAEVITEDIIEQQSLDVDVITGATHSSKVILLAVEDALEKAQEQSQQSQ